MAPTGRKGPTPPPAQSDESDDSFDQPVKKPKKKNVTKKTEEISEKSAEKQAANLNDSMEDDENENLLDMPIPEKPQIFENYQNRKDRLMIYKIDVHNFKSYHGTSTIGPFHKSFTSIIGPNGSGKSNVIDSLLFVFGFRSGKIRSKKISNLIHSSAGKQCESCTVAISFQRIIDKSEDEYEVIPNSKFTISRTGYRNNSSTYAIDGKTVGLKDVEARLREVDIDLTHNRFLILQGEVEAISMMKPKGVNKNEEGMLEYLEDIVGTNRFAKPIEKLERRLDRLSTEVSQQKIRRETARSIKAGLEPDVREAVEYLKRENEVATIRNQLEHRRKFKYLNQLGPLEEQLNAKKEEMREVGEKLDANKKGVGETEKMDKEMNKRKSELESECDKVKREIEDDATEEKKRKQNMKRINGDIEKLEGELEKEKKKRETLVDAPEKAAKKIAKLKSESEDLQEIEKSATEQADANLAEFDQRSQQFQAEKTEAEREFAEMNEKLNEVKGKATVANAELVDLRKMADKGKNTLAELRGKLEDSEERFQAETEELEEIDAKLPDVQREFKSVNEEAPAARAKQQETDRGVRQLMARIHDLQQDQMRAISGNRVTAALTKEKDSGRIPGFIGRLGDLGAIDKIYDKAISTNCGMLNFYITQHSDYSQQCVDFLRDNKLPRSSFLGLDRVRVDENRMNRSASAFPAPRLFDLVKCDDADIRRVFYFALDDILVVKNFDEALKLDKQHNHRFAFVTLNGDKLGNDASITGGGNGRTGLIGTEVKVGRQSTVDQNMVKRFEEELVEKKEALEKVAETAKQLDKRLFELRSALSTMDARRKVLVGSVEQRKMQIDTLRKTIDAQEAAVANVKVDVKEIAERQKILDQLIEERDEAAERANNAKQRVDEITGKVDAIFNELVGRHRSEAKDARTKRLAIEKTIAKETGAINNSEMNIAKCDDRIAQLEKDAEKKRKDVERLEQSAVDEEKIEEKREVVRKIEEEIRELEQKFKDIREQKNALGKEELELEKRLKEAAEEVAGMKGMLVEKRRKVEEIDAVISKLRLNKIPLLSFLNVHNRPEELRIEFDNDLNMEKLAEMTPDELTKYTKTMANACVDQVYSLEYGMRNQVANEPEPFELAGEAEKLPALTNEAVEMIDSAEAEQLAFRRKTIEQQLEASKGKVNLNVIDDYIERLKKYNDETEKMKKIMDNYNAHRVRLLYLKKLRFNEFDEGFKIISASVREVYQMLTIGGDSSLAYATTNDPFGDGIRFMVRPHRKTWKNIENLSGGEKTLASLSLVFALHQFRPTPFYVMDEIDAALDYRNVSIIGRFVKLRTQNAQFIIISLRNNMFELANRLVGIYKIDDCTQNVAIDPFQITGRIRQCMRRMNPNDETAITPDEVTAEYARNKANRKNEQVANEKQYANFPSTSDIVRAEKIVDIETKVRKKFEAESRGTSAASKHTRTASQASTTRPESRIFEKIKMPNVRLVRPAPESDQVHSPTDPPLAKRRLTDPGPEDEDEEEDDRAAEGSNTSLEENREPENEETADDTVQPSSVNQ